MDFNDFEGGASDSSDAQGGPINLFAQNAKITVVKTKINTAMKAAELVKELPKMVKDTPPNSRKEITLKLNPEELGTVEVNISRNAQQQISIQLTVNNDSADKVLRQKLIELTASLADKGISIEDINVSKADGSNSNAFNSNDQGGFNEAAEEQRQQQEESRKQQEAQRKKEFF